MIGCSNQTLSGVPSKNQMVGNVSKSFVKNCSVHNSFNRGITIHGVDNLLVEHNVVFDTRGHTCAHHPGSGAERPKALGAAAPVFGAPTQRLGRTAAHPPRAMHTDPGCIVPAGAMRAAACHPEEACVAGAPVCQFAVTRALVPRAAEGWRRRRADTPTALADFIGRRRFARRERKAAAMACHALAAVSTARHQRAEQSGAPPGSRCGALTQYL